MSDPALGRVEAALKGLTPAPPALERDRLMFRAGAESAGRSARPWRWAAVSLAVTTAGLAGLVLVTPKSVERTVYVRAERREPAGGGFPLRDPREPGEATYLRMERIALARGVEALDQGRGAYVPTQEHPSRLLDLPPYRKGRLDLASP